MSRLLELCDEVERLDKAATPGPWRCGDGRQNVRILASESSEIATVWTKSVAQFNDAHSIAHYRLSAPQLARAVRVLYESMERIMDLAHISSSAVGRDIYKETERALEAVEVDEEKKTVKILE